MNFTQFIEKYKGRFVDWDNIAGVQCVDLIDQYLQDVFRVEHIPLVSGAREFYTRFEDMSAIIGIFDKIPNTRELVTKRGDIVVWNGGKFGHIAIDDGGGDIDVFYSWEQNTRGKHEPVQLVKHLYSGKGANDYNNPVLGVLRPKSGYQYLVRGYTFRVVYKNGMNIREMPTVFSSVCGFIATGRTFEANETTVTAGQMWAHVVTGGWVCVDEKFCKAV